ncbi:ATP-binding cassette domain-containing protein [Kushneria phosphatilytica]|uniref:Probable ATP-binding protein YheS n=1 Tax=Kushneria phosphatilytica TaxID=657387 RepID=A0A5C0ZWQ8_9GAMM|nr:ATP-binding cassette domain-containing protein [Kushneria phosphatilytica]QEL09773.1 ATP-binding cassette domain-containing protein [Kushneria phosphatilytica]
MIAFRQLALQRGGTPLIESADFTLSGPQKVGIVGANGAGKSSLFSLLLGELTPDQGEVDIDSGTRIAHMAQEIEALDRGVTDYVLDGDDELRRTEIALARARAAEEHEHEARLHGEIEALDGYTARPRAEQLLVGLGFAQSDLDRPLADFSGGWRMRANLARTLFMPSDLMLLDEPTNHLDLDALLWLEQWLSRYDGTLMLISHDRDFLDAVCDHIAHFEARRVTLYRGNYSTFERTRAERLAQQQAEYEKQQARRAEIERFVERFRAKATKARQAQSRLKMLERMEEVAPLRANSPFQFTLPAAEKVSNPLLALDRADIGYGDSPLLTGVRLSLEPGSRIGLLGPNGAGKSTLIKALTGALPLLAGSRVEGEHLAIGYFAQHQLDSLDMQATPYTHVQRLSPQAGEQVIRNFLGGFGFRGDDVFASAERFSGGEKARLALALIAWHRPNLLLLDEPTNHLDLEMREALVDALTTFEGAVVIVSHDRHLLRASVDDFWCVADGSVTSFDGDLDDYRAWLKARVDQARRQPESVETTPESTDSAREGRGDRKAARQAAAERREQLKPLRKRRDQAEKAVNATQQKLDRLEEQLADPGLYEAERKEEMTRLLREQGELRSQLDEQEQVWLEAEEALETLEAELTASQ